MNTGMLNGFTRATESREGADPREAVFYRVDRRRSPNYPQLHIYPPHPPTHPDTGQEWPYTEAEKKTYWAVTLYRFNGAELETDETLHRNYMPPLGVTPNLGPIFFDRQLGTNLALNIAERFTFNGFAFKSGKVTDWGQRFVNPNVTKDTVALAQARVYNHFSWDLFTQHWRVKLVRGDRWKKLLDELAVTLPPEAGDVATQLTPEAMESVKKMLEFYDEDFVAEVIH
jgi:hypothetical protein